MKHIRFLGLLAIAALSGCGYQAEMLTRAMPEAAVCDEATLSEAQYYYGPEAYIEDCLTKP